MLSGGGGPLPSRQRVINVWVIRRKRPSITGQESNQSPSIIFLSHICISDVAGCWIISSIRGENKNKQKHTGPFFVCSASTSHSKCCAAQLLHLDDNVIRIVWTFQQSYITTTEKAHLLRARLSNWISNGRHDIKEKRRGENGVIYARLDWVPPCVGFSIVVDARRKWQNKSG